MELEFRLFTAKAQPEPRVRDDKGRHGGDGPQNLDYGEAIDKRRDKLDICIAVHNDYEFC